MRKILFITAFPPNRRTAGQDYTRRLLDDLVQKGHSVSLVYTSYPGHEVEVDDRIEILCVMRPHLTNCLRHPGFHPFFTRRFDDDVLALVRSAAADFDILYFDFSQVHLYSLFVSHPRKILMCHDVIAQKFARRGKVWLPWIRAGERAVLSSAAQILVFSEKDSAVVRRTYGLDAEPVNFYLKNDGCEELAANLDVMENTFCFYGAWNRAENAESLLWFVHKVLPCIPENLRFLVIGGGMSARLQSKLSAIPAVSFIGFVENPILEIARCQALVAPLRRGAGVKVKVIDALSSGTKVIGTEIAFEGIDDNAAHPLLCRAHRADDFIRILRGWQSVSCAEKQAASEEFRARYNTTHFADTI